MIVFAWEKGVNATVRLALRGLVSSCTKFVLDCFAVKGLLRGA